MSGPLLPFAEGYSAHLAELGYLPASVRAHVELLAQVSRWMDDEGLDVAALSPRAVERFRTERHQRGYVSNLSPRKLRPLVSYLDGLGVLPAVAPVAPTEVDRLIGEFCDYLARERGLVPGSVTLYARVAGRFLDELRQPIADELARLSGAEVNAFVLRESAQVRPRTATYRSCAAPSARYTPGCRTPDRPPAPGSTSTTRTSDG